MKGLSLEVTFSSSSGFQVIKYFLAGMSVVYVASQCTVHARISHLVKFSTTVPWP